MKKLFFGVAVGLWMTGVSGFGQAVEDIVPPETGEVFYQELMSMSPDELRSRADDLLQKGDTNAAINVLTHCSSRSQWQAAEDFNAVLNTMLAAGNLADAESVFQDALACRNNLERNYYHGLHQYYAGRNDAPALLEWAVSLQAKPLPPDLSVQAFAWLFEASRMVGPVSRVTDLVPVCIAKWDAPTACNLLAEVVSAYDRAGDQASANKVLDAIERTARLSDELRRLVTCQRINLLFSAAQWDKAEKRFQKEAAALPDDKLAECFRYARACLVRADQFDLLDRLCVWILKEQTKKPGAWQSAAATWLESAKIRGLTADIIVRLQALMRMGCSNNNLASFYSRYWESVAKTERRPDLDSMMQFGAQLAAATTNKQDKELLQVFAFDGHVIVEDYAGALQMLAEPFPNMAPGDQEIAVNKVKAHLALQRGDKQEAVERFRKFMETVKTWPEPEFNYINGLMYTKEMCLGLNAKRIGDILGSLDDRQGALAAYREADDYYVVAAKEIRADSPERKYIEKCRADLAKLLSK